MRFSSRSVVAAACVVLLVAAGCAGRNSDAGASASQSDVGFWAGMRVQATWTYFETLREMWEISDVTIIGRIIAVREGRTLGGQRGERGTQTTALVQIQLDELVRGELANDSRRIVDVEIWRANDVPIEEVAVKVPNEPILLLLQDVAGQPKPREVDDSAVIREPGKTLYTIRHRKPCSSSGETTWRRRWTRIRGRTRSRLRRRPCPTSPRRSARSSAAHRLSLRR